MKKAVVGALILYLGLFVSTALAVEVTWLGPKQYIRTKGNPDVYTDSFHARTGTAKIIVINGNEDGSNRISSAEITLNGTSLFGPSNFNQQVDRLITDIYLQEENTLMVELKSHSGKPHFLTISVIQDVPPPEATLSVDPQTIIAGQSANISWVCNEAETCTLEPGIGQVEQNGSLEVSPFETTTYTLTSASIAGSAVSSIKVTVNHPPTAHISIEPQTITLGQPATLTWTTTYAEAVTIEPDVGTVPPNGSIQVTPDQSTTYTITAIGTAAMTATDSVDVNVRIPMPTVSISASATTIVKGQSLTLRWSATNAESCVITPNVGEVPISGSVQVAPLQDTTYVVSAYGPGGSASANLAIAVTEPAGPPTVQLTPSEITIALGQSVTLSWTSTGADKAHIDNGVGIVTATGAVTIDSLEHTTFFTLTVTGPNGSASAVAAVYVTGPPLPQPEGTFGAMYNDLIPEDATIAAYDEERFSLITGQVNDILDRPVEGVVVSVLDKGDYGTAVTDADGRFSLPIDGGTTFTVSYHKPGLLPSQRKVYVPWNDIVNVETIQMIAEDPLSTKVSFDGNPETIMTHESTLVSDSFGSRSSTLVFSGDNQAWLVDEKGNDLLELSTINVRATEYTTPKSMPAKLPPSSAYTYCVEFSVDGVERVRFKHPVVVWVDNFLGFDIGEPVPVGYYDKDKGQWFSSNNGIVVQLMDLNGDGIVDALDADGDQNPDDLDGDGQYDDEIAGLSDPRRYTSGASFWRVELLHFTPGDLNWPYSPESGSIPPANISDLGIASADLQPKASSMCNKPINSFVEERSRVFHEDIPIPGTAYELHYASNRTIDYQTVITVPTTTETPPAPLKNVVVEVWIAGRTFRQILEPESSQVATFVWDGYDYLGRPVDGKVTANVNVGYLYNTSYARPNKEFPQAFAMPGEPFSWDGSMRVIWAREQMIYWKQSELQIGAPNKKESSIANGWSISAHHQINLPDVSTLYKGDGTTVGKEFDYILQTVKTKDGNAVSAASNACVATNEKGEIFFSDPYNHQISKIDRDGNIVLVAGTGVQGFSGDGGPATDAKLNSPFDMVFDSQGNLYFIDFNNGRIRKISKDGRISTVGGTGWVCENNEVNGMPANQASLCTLRGLAVDDQGNVYSTGSGSVPRIYKIDANGILSLVTDGIQGIIKLEDIAIDNYGNIFVAYYGFAGPGILKIDNSGTITRIAGPNGPYGVEGYPALNMRFGYIKKIAIDNWGNIFFSEIALGGTTFPYRIGMITTNGIVKNIAGNRYLNYPKGEDVPATSVTSGAPFGLALDPANNIYYTAARVGGGLLKVTPTRPSAADKYNNQISFTENNGLTHLFSPIGLHQATVETHTGKTLLTFDYDQNKKLIAIVDSFGNQTTLARSSGGPPYAIVSPDGLTTSLSIDSENNLKKITYPDGSYYQFEYTSGGLMTAEIEPNGNRFEHLFDPYGHLQSVSDPEQGLWQYSRSVAPNGDVLISALTGENNLTTYLDQTDSIGRFTSVITDPAGSTSLYKSSADGLTVTKSLSCGMDLTFTYDLDQQFKYKFVDSVSEKTPSALEKITLINNVYEDADRDYIPDRIIKTINVNNKVTTITQDIPLAQNAITSPENRVVVENYDPDTLLTTSLSVPGLFDTEYGYDSRGRLTSIRKSARQTDYTYNGQGFIQSVIDPENHTTSFSYDAVGRPVAVHRPDGGTVRFLYDPNGNMTVLTNPVDVDHGFSYNGVNLRSDYETPLSGGYRYLYDKDRNLIQTDFPSGKQILNIYTDGRLTQIRTPEDNIDMVYSCGSKVSSMTKGAETIGYTYDGKLLTDVTVSGTLNQILNFTYNNDFNLIAMTYAGATENFSYDLDGLLTGAGGYAISRNAANGLPESVSGNGLAVSRSFNGYTELASQTASVGSQPMLQWSLTRDNAGRITAKTETIDNETHQYAYGYDAMGRLLTVTRDGDQVESYSYDLSGTRISETNTLRGISDRSLSYSDEDHLLTAGDAVYAYNPDGFLTTRTMAGKTTTFDYSTRGELLEVQLPDGRIISYEHDPLGRRIAKRIDGVIVEKYLWQGLTKLLAVYDGSDILKQRFEYADDRMPVAMIMAGTRYYLAYDQVGSLRILADGAGNVAKRIDYDAFGNIISDSNPAMALPFGFAGGLHDQDTGLVRFGYRDYDPDTGRWTAKDPIGFDGGDTDLFGYVRNNPVNSIDPWGLFDAFTHPQAYLGTVAGSSANWSAFPGYRPQNPYPSGFATGWSIELSTINPITSGGGGAYGFNFEVTTSEGIGLYYYYTPNNQGSIGFSPGISFTGNFAFGNGSWTGPFDASSGSISGITGGYFDSANECEDQGYSGGQLGVSFGPSGYGETRTNYVKW